MVQEHVSKWFHYNIYFNLKINPLCNENIYRDYVKHLISISDSFYFYSKHTFLLSGSSSTPRMEPFASGQIFNVSHLDRVHVLPPAHPSPAIASSTAFGNVVSTNSKSTLVPTILKSVSRNPSSLSSLQPADKETKYVKYYNIIICFWLNNCAQPQKVWPR